MVYSIPAFSRLLKIIKISYRSITEQVKNTFYSQNFLIIFDRHISRSLENFGSYNVNVLVNCLMEINVIFCVYLVSYFKTYLSSNVIRTEKHFVKCRKRFYLQHSPHWVTHVSQRMTFSYSPRLSNRSSRPVTKPTASISKAWWAGGMPNLDRMIAPLQMRVDTVSYPRACVVRPPKWPYIRRHIGLSQAVRVWQPVSPDSRVVHNPGPSWDFRLGLHLARSPLHRQIRLVLVVYLSVVLDPGKDGFAWTVIIVDSHRYVTTCNRGRRNRP